MILEPRCDDVMYENPRGERTPGGEDSECPRYKAEGMNRANHGQQSHELPQTMLGAVWVFRSLLLLIAEKGLCVSEDLTSMKSGRPGERQR